MPASASESASLKPRTIRSRASRGVPAAMPFAASWSRSERSPAICSSASPAPSSATSKPSGTARSEAARPQNSAWSSSPAGGSSAGMNVSQSARSVARWASEKRSLAASAATGSGVGGGAFPMRWLTLSPPRAWQDQGVRTAIVSDLHLGAANDSDMLRRREALDVLLGGISGSDRLVLLGDVIELRDRPLGEAIELAVPVLEEIAQSVDGDLVLVPGNHDHRLVSGWLEQRALAGRRPLRLADRARIDAWPASALRDALGDVEWRISYPGLWVRDDVYATHGHYLDRHLTIPTFERLGLALVERTLGLSPALPDPLDDPDHQPEPDSPDDYEQITAPIYAFLFALAQAGPLSGHPGGTPSKRVWDALSGGDSAAGKIRGWLLGFGGAPGSRGGGEPARPRAGPGGPLARRDHQGGRECDGRGGRAPPDRRATRRLRPHPPPRPDAGGGRVAPRGPRPKPLERRQLGPQPEPAALARRQQPILAGHGRVRRR